MIVEQESITAKLCAFARAWHSIKSKNKIFDDYLAFDIMGKEQYDEMYDIIKSGFGEGKNYSPEDTEQIIQEYMAPIPLARIKFTENRLKRFKKKHGKIQYVICGAGSDTFSFRNDDPDIEIFEVDHPDTQRFKKQRLKELEWNIPSNVHFVSVDFETEKMTEKLLENGFDPEKKTFFSILGVSYYLTLPVFRNTLDQISELSPLESALVFDYPVKEGIFPPRVKRLEGITRSLGEVMKGGFDYGEISRALYSLGFQIDTFLNAESVQEVYFSDRDDDLRAFENVNLLSAIYTGGFDYE